MEKRLPNKASLYKKLVQLNNVVSYAVKTVICDVASWLINLKKIAKKKFENFFYLHRVW